MLLKKRTPQGHTLPTSPTI